MMETMPLVDLPVAEPELTDDNLFIQQSLLFADSIKDMKNLRSQLYSAAECFEVSYLDYDEKQLFLNTLKDFAAKALGETVDHLGSVTHKVKGDLDEKANDVSVSELQVSAFEQRLRACQEYIDRAGLSQQSLVFNIPKYHKRYILPVRDSNSGSGNVLANCQGSITVKRDKERKLFQSENQLVSKAKNPLATRKEYSRPPTPPPEVFGVTDKGIIFPRSGSLSLVLSKSFSTRQLLPRLEKMGWQKHRKSTSMQLDIDRDKKKEAEQHSNKSKSLLKTLFSWRKIKEDDMLYSYLDEY